MIRIWLSRCYEEFWRFHSKVGTPILVKEGACDFVCINHVSPGINYWKAEHVRCLGQKEHGSSERYGKMQHKNFRRTGKVRDLWPLYGYGKRLACHDAKALCRRSRAAVQKMLS